MQAPDQGEETKTAVICECMHVCGDKAVAWLAFPERSWTTAQAACMPQWHAAVWNAFAGQCAVQGVADSGTSSSGRVTGLDGLMWKACAYAVHVVCLAYVHAAHL